MSRWQQLLDLDGQSLSQPVKAVAAVQLPDDLAGPTLLITDFGSAPFGVETLPAHSKRLAPIVEKRLRDQGDIDGLAQVLVHASERQENIARVFYTAVPIADYLRYHQFGKHHPDHLLLFPLADALLALAHQQELNNGLLLFVHGSCVDVLLLRQGQVHAARRLRCFGDEPVEQLRLAIALEQLWTKEGLKETDLVLLEHTSGAGASLSELLAQKGLIKAIPASLGPQHLFAALNLLKSTQAPVERVCYLSTVILPWVAMTMVLLCLLAGSLMTSWRLDAQSLQTTLSSTDMSTTEQLRQSMNDALQETERLAVSQQTLTEFIHLAERVRRVPDPASLIRHLRQTTPNGITLTEASIVSDQEGGLIVVVGRSQSAAAPLDAESRFVKALEQQGYRVVRREIEGGAASSLFRLVLTWSES